MKKIALFIYDNFRIYGLPLLAALGLFMGVSTVRAGNAERTAAAPVTEPARSPFLSSVAGAGIVESSGENTLVATNIPGVIESVFVKVGQEVLSGDALFTIDTRELSSLRAIRESTLGVAKAQLLDAQSQLEFLQKIVDKRAISADDLSKKQNAVKIAEARVHEAVSSLQQTLTDLERAIVRAPVDGKVLKIHVRKGEFASTQGTAPMMLGETKKLWVRVDIDENDAWRVSEGAKARATLRGNSSLGVDLAFVRFEPYVTPKRSLTGESSERVDTRVLQIIYEFEPSSFPVYVGQLMDVYIEAKPHG